MVNKANNHSKIWRIVTNQLCPSTNRYLLTIQRTSGHPWSLTIIKMVTDLMLQKRQIPVQWLDQPMLHSLETMRAPHQTGDRQLLIIDNLEIYSKLICLYKVKTREYQSVYHQRR